MENNNFHIVYLEGGGGVSLAGPVHTDPRDEAFG